MRIQAKQKKQVCTPKLLHTKVNEILSLLYKNAEKIELACTVEKFYLYILFKIRVQHHAHRRQIIQLREINIKLDSVYKKYDYN